MSDHESVLRAACGIVSPVSDDAFDTPVNEHLRPVFEVLLPAITSAGLSYWVYGGVGIAGVVCEFFRNNRDVDIYVRKSEFPAVRTKLLTECQSHGASWLMLDCEQGQEPERRKLEVHIGVHGNPPTACNKGRRTEVLSVVDVRETEDSGAVFLGPTRVSIPKGLVKEPRRIEGYTFVSPPRNTIADIFKSLILERPGLLVTDDRRAMDAKRLLPPPEHAALAEAAYDKVQRKLARASAKGDTKEQLRWSRIAERFTAQGLLEDH